MNIKCTHCGSTNIKAIDNSNVIKVNKDCPCCGDNTKVRKDFNFFMTMLCCDKCGADFTVHGEIISDPRLIK